MQIVFKGMSLPEGVDDPALLNLQRCLDPNSSNCDAVISSSLNPTSFSTIASSQPISTNFNALVLDTEADILAQYNESSPPVLTLQGDTDLHQL